MDGKSTFEAGSRYSSTMNRRDFGKILTDIGVQATLLSFFGCNEKPKKPIQPPKIEQKICTSVAEILRIPGATSELILETPHPNSIDHIDTESYEGQAFIHHAMYFDALAQHYKQEYQAYTNFFQSIGVSEQDQYGIFQKLHYHCFVEHFKPGHSSHYFSPQDFSSVLNELGGNPLRCKKMILDYLQQFIHTSKKKHATQGEKIPFEAPVRTESELVDLTVGENGQKIVSVYYYPSDLVLQKLKEEGIEVRSSNKGPFETGEGHKEGDTGLQVSEIALFALLELKQKLIEMGIKPHLVIHGAAEGAGHEGEDKVNGGYFKNPKDKHTDTERHGSGLGVWDIAFRGSTGLALSKIFGHRNLIPKKTYSKPHHLKKFSIKGMLHGLESSFHIHTVSKPVDRSKYQMRSR